MFFTITLLIALFQPVAMAETDFFRVFSGEPPKNLSHQKHKTFLQILELVKKALESPGDTESLWQVDLTFMCTVHPEDKSHGRDKIIVILKNDFRKKYLDFRHPLTNKTDAAQAGDIVEEIRRLLRVSDN